MDKFNLVRDIALEAGLSEQSVLEIIKDAPRRYKVYQIQKKGGGLRTIAQPARELKPIQRSLCNLVLDRFPVHPCAMAYRKGISIADNAKIHAGRNPILKLDFENFFNSISSLAWRRFLATQRVIQLARSDADLLTSALFWGAGQKDPQCLSIGAPSSPTLSNVIMFEFDSQMFKFAEMNRVRYTRYADDITVSAHAVGALHDFEKFVRTYISRHKIPALKINEDKRAIFSVADRRIVTGLILTPDGKVSLGRERKREVSALMHKFINGKLELDVVAYLHGMVAFALSSEAEFVSRLRKKYGEDAVSSVLRFRVPRRDGSSR